MDFLHLFEFEERNMRILHFAFRIIVVMIISSLGVFYVPGGSGTVISAASFDFLTWPRVPLEGQYKVVAQTQNIGIDSWVFTYQITNLTEVGDYTGISYNGPDYTGLDGFYIPIPHNAIISEIQLPDPYFGTPGYWAVTRDEINSMYDGFVIWGNNVQSVYPKGTTLTYSFRIDNVAVGDNQAILTSFFNNLALKYPSDKDRHYVVYSTQVISPVPLPTELESTVLDDFNDNLADLSLWAPYQTGTGPTYTESNQTLEIHFPSNSAGEVFGAAYGSNFNLRGDFDIQVDYALLDWPAQNGVIVGIYATGAMERLNWYYDDVYATHFPPEATMGVTPTNDLYGKLRLVRSGSALTGYYFNSGTWVNIHSFASANTSNCPVILSSWSNTSFGHKEAKVAFDNFVVNQGQLIWPTTSPALTSLVPNAGRQGQTLKKVLFNGNNLTGATALTFSGTGVTAGNLKVNDAGTQITADVKITSKAALGARDVTVTTPAGTSAALAGGFRVTAKPAIKDFAPKSGRIGTSVTITGTNFMAATKVSFGGTAASSVVVNSETKITACAGSGATGKISVTTPGGTATSSSKFTYYGIPTISSFTPIQGGKNTSVVITGTNLKGATEVSFGGTKASGFSINSDTRITAKIESGSTGELSVITPGGKATSNNSFTFYNVPAIGSFSPNLGGNGTAVTITGTDLYGATEVKIGNKTASSFTVDSSTQITAKVGSGSTGKIAVTTPGGKSTSSSSFTYYKAPTLKNFSPAIGDNGTEVTITGTNFKGATAVSFGDTSASSFKVNSASKIIAIVGSGSTGKIIVSTPGGTATSSESFIYYALPGDDVAVKLAHAVTWAKAQIGSVEWGTGTDTYCEKFVEQAFGTSGQYSTAYAAFEEIGLDGSPIIPGQIVFFEKNAGNGWSGHAGVYVGNDQFISVTTTGVQTRSLSSWSSTVAACIGYANPPASWPGR
jgi:hypothetical protein